MGWKKTVAVCAAALIVIMGIYEYNASGNGPECSEIPFEQATRLVADDYGKRLERWEDEVATLGTKQPSLAFDREQTQVSETYMIPFTATGPAGSISRFAILSCKKGQVEYSEQ